MYATDRQMSDAHHRLMAPTLGAGHNNADERCRSLWAEYLTDDPAAWRARVGEHHMFSDIDQDQVDVDVDNIIFHPNRNRKLSFFTSFSFTSSVCLIAELLRSF